MIREVMDMPDVLDDPRAGAAEFNALLPTDVCEDLRDILRMSNFQPRNSFFIAIAYHSHNSALFFRDRDLPGTGRTLCIS